MRIPRSAVAVVLGGAVLLATPYLGDAHTPNYGHDCTGFHYSLVNYPAGSHVTVVTDKVTDRDEPFTGASSGTFQWNPASGHTWSIVVTSPDGIGQVNDSGDQAPCVVPTVPTTTTSFVPIVPGTSVVPPTTLVTPTVPETSTTLPPVTTAAPAPTPTPAPTPSAAPSPPTTRVVRLVDTGSDYAVPLAVWAAAVVLLGTLVVIITRRRSPA
jgi:hypothetical protein